MLRDIATSYLPDLYVNVHAGIREMYMGWDHKIMLIPNSEEVLRLLTYVSQRY